MVAFSAYLLNHVTLQAVSSAAVHEALHVLAQAADHCRCFAAAKNIDVYKQEPAEASWKRF